MNRNGIRHSPVNPIPAHELQDIHARTIGDYEPQAGPDFDPQHGGVSQIERAIDEPATWEPACSSRVENLVLLAMVVASLVLGLELLVGIGRMAGN